jgi:hypothetical protein
MDGWTSTNTENDYDTSATNEVHSVSSNGYITVITYRDHSYITYRDHSYATDKYEEHVNWENHLEQLIRREQFKELLLIDKRIKRKVNLPIIPQNVINKTMNRRMMNGRH